MKIGLEKAQRLVREKDIDSKKLLGGLGAIVVFLGGIVALGLNLVNRKKED